MLFHHEDGHPIFHFPQIKIGRELKNFYAFLTIRGFALYSITIFEPIYLYLFFDRQLVPVFIYLGIRSLVFGVAAPYGVKLTNKFGIKHTILLSTPFTFLYYVGLWQVEFLGSWIYLLAIWGSLAAIVYWPAYHIFFTRISDSGRRGSETSYGVILLSITAALAPLLGGLVIAKFGFPVLFMIVLALLLASTAPLFLSEEIYENYKETFRHSFGDLFRKKYRKKALAFVSWGTETSLQMYVWPLFLFIIAISYEALGAITAGSLIFGMLFAYYIGKATDKKGSVRFLKLGTVANALFWPLKAFVTTPLEAFLANTLHRFSRHAAHIPFTAIFYEWAAQYETSRDTAILVREMSLNISRGLFLFILAALAMLTSNIALFFFFGSVLSFGLLFILDKKKQDK